MERPRRTRGSEEEGSFLFLTNETSILETTILWVVRYPKSPRKNYDTFGSSPLSLYPDTEEPILEDLLPYFVSYPSLSDF